MKTIEWNEEKNQLLKLQRGISFEDILEKIEKKEILALKRHPNRDKYPHQMIFIFEINEYIYYVPFVEDEDKIFLKTIIPSRKLTKEYKRKSDEK
jgi:uncharacterized DUF497 family protein